MKRFAVVLAVAVLSLLGSSQVSFAQHKDHDAKEKQTTKATSVYTCPMHPEVVTNKAGKCPKCGMNLEKKESTGSKMKAAMEMNSMCAKMCDMMMNDPSKMKMMQDCMMMGMNDMKETKGSTGMEGMSIEKMKSCCGMKKNK